MRNLITLVVRHSVIAIAHGLSGLVSVDVAKAGLMTAMAYHAERSFL
ncbi:MAG: hypothetical protein Q8L73_04025 [Methylotenera sp.]|nr:hypothetical protein [Methylotenera sp.]